MTHEVEFFTYRGRPSDAKAVCSCGWFAMGPLDELQVQASCHDLDWVPANTPSNVLQNLTVGLERVSELLKAARAEGGEKKP